MKSFKEFILAEDINNWALSQLGKKFKNGHIDWKGLASNPKDIEELKELYKQEHPNYKDEDLKALDVEKIKKIADRANSRKDALKAFGDKSKNTNKQSFLEKYRENKDEAISAVKRLLSKSKKEKWPDVEKKCSEILQAASVITEADTGAAVVDSETVNNEQTKKSPETEAIENKLKELDEIVIRHGIDINDLFINSNGIEQDDIADQVINFLKKLASDKNIIVDSSKSMMRFLSADENKDKIFTPDEIKTFVSSKDKTNLSNTGKIDPSVVKVLPFIIFILWVNTTASEVLKKVSEKIHGKQQGEDVAENFNAIIKTISEKNLKLDIKSDPFKILGNKFLNDLLSDESYGNLEKKLKEITNEMKTPPEKAEETSASRVEASKTNETKTNETNETKTNEAETDKAETDKADKIDKAEADKTDETEEADGAKGKEYEERMNNAIKNSISSLTRNSTKEEVDAAISATFGTTESPNESEDQNRGTAFANILDAIKRAKKKNQELYDVSHKKEETEIKENNFFFDCANNKLINENALGDARNFAERKFKSSLGRVNLSNNQRNENSWNKCINELRNKQIATLGKAKDLASNLFDKINSVSKKGDIIYKLKKLASNYNTSMTSIYMDYRRANSYNGIGALAHDIRVGGIKAEKKAKEFKKGTKAGQEAEIINQNIESKLQNINAQSLDKYIPENLRDVFAYAVLNQSNPMILQEPDVDSDTGKMTVSKSAFSAVANNNEVFGVGNEQELSVFLAKLLEKANKDPELGAWLTKYKGIYDNKKAMMPIRNAIFDFKKHSKQITYKLKNSQNPYGDICAALGISSENLQESVKSFKDYYLLNEWFGKAKQNNEATPASFTDEEKKSLAALCLLAAVGMPNEPKFSSLKEAAAKMVLSKIGRDEQIMQKLSTTEIISAAQKYVNENSDKVNPAVQGLMAIIKNAEQKQGQGTQNNQNSQNAQNAQNTQNAQNAQNTQNAQNNQNSQNAQNAQNTQNAQNGNTTGTGYLKSKGINNDQDFKNAMDELGNYSVVTSDAVGESKIPDRLYRKMIRRRIGSFV